MEQNAEGGHTDDNDIVARCLTGDEGAFRQLVDGYKLGVATLVFRLVGRSDEVEDISQEIFLRVFRGLAQFRGDSALSTWIYRIAYRVCLKERERRKRNGIAASYDDEMAEMLTQTTSAAQEAELETCDAVNRWIEDLPDHYRQVLALYYTHGTKYEEVAKVMDIPIGTVKTYLHRAKKRLRERFLDEGYLR